MPGPTKYLNPPKHFKKPPRFIEPALAELVKAPPTGSEWAHEVKWDGYRIQAHIENKKIRLFSRGGLDWSAKFPLLVKELKGLSVHNAILDGEVVWLDHEGRSHFHKLQEALHKGESQHLYYYLFDLPFLEGRDLRDQPLQERKEWLKKTLNSLPKGRVRYSDHIRGQGKALFRSACAYGLEGIVSKEINSSYHSGRSSQWLKCKCHLRQEFVIGGYSPGARSDFGALLVGVYEDEQLRYVGKVGTGYSEQTLKELLGQLKRRERRSSPFQLKSPREKGLHWVKPDLVAEVTFANWTADHLLRMAVFHGLREDKSSREVQREELGSPLLRITNPTDLVYAQEGLTKLQVARYYQDVASWILPHITNRPLSLLRCPEGAKKCFFQKHLSGKVPEAVLPIRIKEKGKVETYLTVASKEGLGSLSQMRVLEFHAWGSCADSVEHPDQVVMDFDPGPGVPWKRIIEAAEEFRQILSHLGLKSFVKLSGGKGVHVHVPIAPVYSWKQIKSFARTLAYEMKSRHPERYTLSMSKAAREGKIFLDYFRNERGATFVAPYSLRARELSSVALPLSWRDLGKTKRGDQYTVAKTYKHLKQRKTDPWRDFFKEAPRISILSPA
ncbi:DNA ligase D [Bdellovibrio sp.]|uniref:DNA ligase D n=1 Tax=Bdellovibrio sp. TaxID=28201 RepID=UPI0039E240E7